MHDNGDNDVDNDSFALLLYLQTITVRKRGIFKILASVLHRVQRLLDMQGNSAEEQLSGLMDFSIKT